MALRKKAVSRDGVLTEYHRIALVSIDVNNKITVLTHSYADECGRQVEKDYADGKIGGRDVRFPYVDAKYRHLEYEDGMSIERAYAWLKALPEFEGAQDV